MGENLDPSRWLRPSLPTPPSDRCACTGTHPIVLQPHLSANPISCLACNLEVRPESLSLSEPLARALASWQEFYECFYRLWLDSGEFAVWARRELQNPDSAVNRRGRDLVLDLDRIRRAYYWWFHTEGCGGGGALTRCPVCDAVLQNLDHLRLCEPCSIVLSE